MGNPQKETMEMGGDHKELKKNFVSMLQVTCFPPPGQIYSHRKMKRHCLGLHPYPIMFDNNVEVITNRLYMVEVQMEYEGMAGLRPLETVWGGGGEERVMGEEGRTEFWFVKLDREGVRSSVRSGQIPELFYVD